ncbi:hypothetical protein BKA66DRAFT_423003 [Pyrenochaeta sp. MPI-SDFR-AT-0127]|nr:hypothetical protein BKA66DRAFT_423003 [Pyrenochaeta sp. MPI-SDFR-AT-0127]
MLSVMAVVADAATIYVCTGAKYTGDCTDLDVSAGECKLLPKNDALSSVRMNSYSCTFYTDKGCSGLKTTFSSDQENLRDGTFNDQLTSVRC